MLWAVFRLLLHTYASSQRLDAGHPLAVGSATDESPSETVDSRTDTGNNDLDDSNGLRALARLMELLGSVSAIAPEYHRFESLFLAGYLCRELYVHD